MYWKTVAISGIIVALCLCSHLAEGVKLSFDGNATLASKDDYKYRPLSMKHWQAPGIHDGIVFQSKSVHERKKPLGKDLIESVSYFPLTAPPTAFMAYYVTEKDYKPPLNSDYSKLDITNAAGFIALELIKIAEIDDNDNVVGETSLKDLTWQMDSQAKNKDGLYYTSFAGANSTNPPIPFVVTLTFVASDRLGVLNIHKRIITPLNMECIVRIQNYPYEDPDNGRLRLTLMVASKEDNTADTVGEKRLESGESFKHMYVLISKKGTVGKDDADVDLSDWNKGNDNIQLDNPALEQQLSEKYGPTATVTSMDILFPAGGNDIVFDPIIMGTGKIPLRPGKGMRKDVLVVIIVASVVALILVLAIIAMVVYRYRQRHNYSRI